jgi:hypothetical protein
MGAKVYYEWDIETWDEWDDIIEHYHADKVAELFKFLDTFGDPENPDHQFKIVLVRTLWCESEGVVDRTWAYVNHGYLSPTFQTGLGQRMTRVPKRFHVELCRAKKNRSKKNEK